MDQEFRTELGRNIFYNKYALTQAELWQQRARTIVDDVCGTRGGKDRPLLSVSERDFLVECITNFKFMPGGRYIYYAGRKASFFNNCYLFRGEEDTREEWASLAGRSTSALMTGGGIGTDYSVFRPEGHLLSRTGGRSSGPIPLMCLINEIGRNVMQGGSRRSAIYASLNWLHDDVEAFLKCKNWYDMSVGNTGLSLADLKQQDFNYPCPLDMTNVSLNYDNNFLDTVCDGVLDVNDSDFLDEWVGMVDTALALPKTFITNIQQAMSTGEPGFSFNFFNKENETLRNACSEVTSEDDSDVCNLGSVNMGCIESIEEFIDVCRVASKFLVCGTIRSTLPNDKIKEVREKNRRLGLGLMGVHEWLLKRNMPYEVTPELHSWLSVYEQESTRAANEHCDRLYLNRPIAYRAIAPTGTIGLLAGTTTGLEPLYAVAMKRRYLVGGDKWKHEYTIDHTAQTLIQQYDLDPEKIITAADLAKDPERRIKFQADVQDYVDMAISSTLNLPSWDSKYNNEDKVEDFARTVAKYAPRLRGLTFYPDNARGGQPLTKVSYNEAMKHKGVIFEENDSCKGGVCGI